MKSLIETLPKEWAEKYAEGTELTPAEKKVLRLIAMGLDHMEIAERLGKSYETVRRQSKKARRRLKANTTAHAVAIAISLELI